MNIEILNVDKETVPTEKGSYQKANVAFKNLDSGKVESKVLMSFGAQKKSFDVLALAKQGDSFTVKAEKNAKGYWDWIDVSKSTGTTAPTATKVTASPKSTYETPEERAARQVYIVRQSSLSTAVDTLTVGRKTALDPEEVVKVAKYYEDYVFGHESGLAGLVSMPDDLEDVPV